MNYTELAYYLRGFVEATNNVPSTEQWGYIRYAILSATCLDPVIKVDGPVPEVLLKAMNNCSSCPPPSIDTSKF